MSAVAKKNARTALWVSIGLTMALYGLPLGQTLAYPLVLLSTLAHELGHGIAALMVGNDFDAFVLYSDGSGAAMTSGNPGRLASAFISAGGLVGPAVAAAACFWVGQKGKMARTALILFGALLIMALVLVIRNIFGWFFVSSVAGVCLWSGWKAKQDTCQVMVLFVGVQLALSVFSRSDYLFTHSAQTAIGRQPSDVAQMADALFLPYWFWGLVCGGFSVLVLVLGIRNFLRATR